MNPRCALLPFVFILIAADVQKDDPAAAEAKLLEGNWEVSSTIFDGAKNKNATAAKRKLVFEKNEFSVFVDGKKTKGVAFTLKPGDKPKQIDLTLPGKDLKAQGIYELDGDTLTLCYGEPGAERPTKFESAVGDRRFLLVLKREKADKK